MTANLIVQIENLITGIDDNSTPSVISTRLQEILVEMKREFNKATFKGSDKTRYNAILRFAKECEKHSRQGINGAFIAKDTGHTTLCDGFTLWATPNPIDGLPLAEGENCMDIPRVLGNVREMPEHPLPSLSAIKNALKLAKAKRSKGSKEAIKIKLTNGVYVNCEYLVRVMEMLDGVTHYRHDSKNLHTGLYFQDAHGAYCLLMAIRMQHNLSDCIDFSEPAEEKSA